MVYRVIIEKGEDFGYVVHCPAILGLPFAREYYRGSNENIKDAIRGCLSAWDEEVST